MKILHLLDSGGLYGAEKVLLTLAAEQQENGLKPVILSAGEPGIGDKAIEVEARRLNIPVMPWRMRPGLNFRELKGILEWAASERFDLLHSHGYKFDILLALSLKRSLLGLPFVSTVHGYTATRLWSRSGLYTLLDKLCLYRASGVSVVSSALHRSLRRHPNITLISNGIPADSPQVEPTEILKTLPENFLIYVGRLSREKAVHNLVWAYHRLKDNTDHNLVIVGDGPERSNLEHLVRELNLEEEVLFLGFVADPVLLIRRARALVIPSVTEGLPITLLEAIRERIPVIATPVGDIPQVLAQGRLGFLASGVEREKLQAVLERFIAQEDGAAVQAEDAYKSFHDTYTAEAMEEKYRDFYGKVLD